MGKQTRRKRSDKRRRGGGGGGASSAAGGSNGGGGDSTNSSTVLSRIRHGDPRVRDGALSALAVTLFAPSPAASHKRKEPAVSDELLQAITERIAVDKDVPAARAAAGCLLNYTSATDGNCHRLLHSTKNVHITAVLASRIARALDNRCKKPDKERQKLSGEWEVTSSCLATLSTLVECTSGGSAVEELTMGEFLSTTILRVMATAAVLVTDPPSQGGAAKGGEGSSHRTVECRAQLEQSLMDSVTYTARILHGALEGNVALARRLMAVQNLQVIPSSSAGGPVKTGGGTALDVLAGVISDARCPAKARLHACGAVITARHVLVATSQNNPMPSEEHSVAQLEECIRNTVLPVLSDYVVNSYRPEITVAMARRIQVTENRLRGEADDAKIERMVEKVIEERKEPARSIARRLAAQGKGSSKDGKGTDDGAEEDGAPMMVTDDDTSTAASTSDGKDAAAAAATAMREEEGATEVEKTSDVRGDYEKVVAAWHNAALPLSLALEVAANLSAGTSATGNTGDVMYASDDDEGWASDDEERMECMARSMDVAMQDEDEDDGDGQRIAPHDARLFEAVIKSGLPDEVLTLLGVLCAPLPLSPPSGSAAASISGGAPPCDALNAVPAVVAHDIAELQSKCGACIGNMAASLPSWREGTNGTLDLWRSLVAATSALLDDSASSNNISEGIDDPSGGREGLTGISGAMVALLRTHGRRKVLLPTIGEGDLTLMLRLLQHEEGTKKPTEARQNAVAMVGTLCMEPHSAEVNAAVCSALVRAMAEDPSVAVVSEALNVIMDVYGDDDCRQDVFVARGVLTSLRRALPTFRRRVQQQAVDLAADEVDQLKETALNASRFIKYKEQQLKN